MVSANTTVIEDTRLKQTPIPRNRVSMEQQSLLTIYCYQLTNQLPKTAAESVTPVHTTPPTD